MKNTILIAIAALLVGAAGGYLAGRGGGEKEPSSEGDKMLETKSGRPGVASMAEGATRRSHGQAQGLSEIRRKPGQFNRLEALMEYFADLDPSQFESEAAKLDALPFQERIMSAFLLFSRWGEVDPLGAMVYSKKMGFVGMFATPSILRSWAGVDPENAAQYYRDHPREFTMMGMGPMRGQTGGTVIAAEWARNDPEGALAWARTLEGSERSKAISSVLREMAASDPAAAAAQLSILNGEDLGRSYREIAKQWGAKNWQDAQAWVNTLPAEERPKALASAIEGLAIQDPKMAASELAKLPQDQVTSGAVEAVAQSMARDDPAAAAKWLTGLKAEDTGNAMRDVMMSWSATDPAGAVNFIREQPEGDLRDDAAATYVWSDRSGNPSQTIAVAEMIGDESKRTRAVSRAAASWMREDETAAKQYIQSTNTLDEAAKKRLLEGRGPGFGRRGRR